MAERIRAHDWASTPLGAISRWPQSLKSAVDLMLCSRQPASIAFGPALTFLHNDACIPFLGTQHPKCLGHPYTEVWPELWPKLKPFVEAALAGEGRVADDPIPLLGRASGPVSWFTCSWTPLRDEAGVVKGVYCSATDATAQVVAQQALQESEERLRFCLRGAGAAAWQCDLKTREQVWSPESYELHGRDPRLGAPSYQEWLNCLHPEDRARMQQIETEVVGEKCPEYRTEYRIVLPSGEMRWLAALGRLDWSEDGSPLRISGINLDITERKWAEKALRESEEQLRFCVRGAGAAAWQSDIMTRRLVWSPECCELHGLDPKLGSPQYDDWLRSIHPDDRDRAEKTNLDALIRQTSEFRLDYRVILPTGEIRWIGALGRVEYAADRPLRMSGICLDITESKRAEQSLRQAEEAHRQRSQELETILAAIPATVLIAKDADCAEIIGNPAAHRLRRVAPQSSLSKSAASRRAPINYEVYSKGRRLSPSELPMQKAAATKRAVVSEELELRYSDGAVRFELANALPLFNDAGDGCGSVGVFTDITDLKVAEAALRENEERLRFALDAAKAGTGELVLDTREMFASERGLALLGISQGEPLTIETVLACLHPDDRERALDAFRRTQTTGEYYRWEVRVPLPDGTVRWLEFHLEQQLVAGRRVMGALVLDITERKQVELALRESEELLRAIIEHVPAPILLSREDRKILLINPALTKLTGYTASDIPTRDEWEALAYHENAESIKGLVRNAFELGVPSDRGELWIYTKTGEKRLWAIKTAPAGRDASGKRIMVTVGLDITERKRSEEALANALRLEAVGKLAGGVAHDFNNLLAVIAGNLELAEDRIDDETVRDLIRRALNAAEKGGALNHRLLSLARQRILKPEKVSLNCRVEETTELLKSTLSAGIEVTTDLAPDAWMTLADPGEIDSAILNIAANARDAMPNGGEIRISAANVSINAGEAAIIHPDARAGDYVRLAVADDGVGMTEDVLGKAMEPFFTTKGSGAGMGLGLASVASFAKQTGGFAVLESSPGRGCAVSLYLPRSTDDAAAPERRDGELPLGDGELVLVVEDDDQVREVTLKRIESLGYAVTEARTGPEAIRLLKSEDPVQLVLSDIVMPGGMTGYDVARWVSSNKPDTQIILCSSYNGDACHGDAQRYLSDVVILGKPYNRDQLARALSDALSTSKMS